MSTLFRPPLAGLAATLLALLCASCSTQAKKAAPTQPPADRQVLKEGEYEYVRVTGSNIPVRVPKSPTARPLPPASPVTEMSPDDFRNAVQRGLSGHR